MNSKYGSGANPGTWSKKSFLIFFYKLSKYLKINVLLCVKLTLIHFWYMSLIVSIHLLTMSELADLKFFFG